MTPEFILYSYYRSSSAYRVRIALNYKEIPHELQAVHLLNNGGEQHRPEYVALNPTHDVPTLVHAGKAIGQSVAIIEYIEQVAANPSLFPKTPMARALVLQACEIINSAAQPLINLRVLKKLQTDFKISDGQKADWTKFWIDYGLKAFDQHIKPHAGKYCFADNITAADCFLVPQLFSARRFSVDLAPFPKLLEIEAALKEHPAFAKAAPENQPDFQP
jgi:maleylacetoacetate isomerase